MLNLGSEKMSKSVGNVLTIRSLLEKHSSEVLRYALLSGQYSSSLTWSDDLLAQARASLDSLYQGLRDAVDTTAQTSTDIGLAPEEFLQSVVNALRRFEYTQGVGRHARTGSRHAPDSRQDRKSSAFADSCWPVAGRWDCCIRLPRVISRKASPEI